MALHKRYRVPKIVASDHQVGLPWRVLLILALMAASAAVGYFITGQPAECGFAVFNPAAEKRIETLKAEREDLMRRLAMAEQAAKLDREALTAVKQNIKTYQDERLAMEEELAFLKGIVSTDDKAEGLKVTLFNLNREAEPGLYSYRLAVSQTINSGITAKGYIKIDIEGLAGDKTKTLALAEISPDKQDKIKMRFRYFQYVDGQMKLPDGFEPSKMLVNVEPSSSKLSSVSQSFDWPTD